MTEQEAIEAIKIKEIEITGNALRLAEFFQGIGVAKQALEKQIPKKAKLKITGTTGWNTEYRCPTCNGLVTKGYCWHCSQALDWSDTE